MPKMRALGTSITYAPAYNSADIDTKVIGSLTSVGEISPDSEELDATCLDSSGGYREFLQGFKDSGELTLAGYLDPDKPGQAQMVTLYGSGALGYFWVTFPDQATVAFNAYVKSFTAVSYTHLRAHETPEHLVCRPLLEKKKYLPHTITHRSQHSTQLKPCYLLF